MRILLLGPLEVEDERGAVRVAPGRESALLALLLARRPDALPTDVIVDELWGENAPENARKGVQVYVSRLRRALGADRIETTPAGYRIRIERDELDLELFEERLRAGDPAGALALWRGAALADFRYLPFAVSEARRLEELRDGAAADLLDARLAGGETPVAELEELVARAPLSERPRGQLMRALYLAGRQADALEVYRETRRLLSDELGVEPGRELQRLEHLILNHDPELGTPRRAPPSTRRRPLLLLVAGGVLIAVAAIAAAIVVGTRGGSARIAEVQGDAVIGLDARSGRIVEQVAVGNRPARLAARGHDVWAINAGDATVAHFDSRDPARVETFGTQSVPTDLAAAEAGLWVGSGGGRSGRVGPAVVTRFDPVRHLPLAAASLASADRPPPGYRAPEQRFLVAGAGAVWALDGAGTVVEIDGRTGRVERRTAVFASSLAFGDGRLWALDGGRDTVERLDLRTGRVLATVHIPTVMTLGGIAVGGGSVWVTSVFQGLVWRVDPGPPPSLQSIPLAYGAATIAYGAGAVWVGDNFDDSITRIDPRTNRTRTVASVPAPQDIAIAGDRVWVAAGSSAGRSGPLTTSSCGSVVRKGQADALIVSDFDLEGPSSTLTQPMAATVLATIRAARFRAGRFTVALQPCDDASRAAGGLDVGQCIANARAYALDRSVVGVVGLQSPCVHAELPILDRVPDGPLGLVSPTSTDPSLTRPLPGFAGRVFAQLRGPHGRGYVRTIAADHVQVAADALLARRLGIRRIGVVFNRRGLTSQAEYGWFRYAARRLPGLRVVPIVWNGPGVSLRELVARARVDGVFLTGAATQGPDEALEALRELRAALPRGRIIATDWITPLTDLASGGDVLRGVYVTLGGVVRDRDLSTAARTVMRGLPAKDRIPYVVGPTVEATRAMLTAIASSDGTRASVARALVSERAFDRGGDLVNGAVTVFRLEPGAHNDSHLDIFQGAVVDSVVRPPSRLVIPPGGQAGS